MNITDLDNVLEKIERIERNVVSMTQDMTTIGNEMVEVYKNIPDTPEFRSIRMALFRWYYILDRNVELKKFIKN